MANGCTTNHTSADNGNRHTNGAADTKPTSAAEGMENTVEFRLMMTYAQRRRPGDVRFSARGGPSAQQGGADTNGPGAPKTSGETDKVKRGKKRKGAKKRLRRFLSCVRPRGEEGEREGADGEREGEEERGEPCGYFRSMEQSESVRREEGLKEEGGEEGLKEVVCRLTQIADGIEFTPPDIEHDGEEDGVEKLLGLLLRETGDRFSEEVLKDASLARELFGNYSFFERLISAFLSRMGFATFNPEAPGSQGSPKTQIALTCEVTNRLSVMDTHPMNCLMGFGAKYLQDHYSKWVEQQGGYEEAFNSDDEDEVH